MVKRGVNKEVGVGATSWADIPCATLDTHSVTDRAELFELTISNDNAILAQQANLASVRRPDNILDLGSCKLSDDTATLNFEENSTMISTENNTTRGTAIVETVNVGDGS